MIQRLLSRLYRWIVPDLSATFLDDTPYATIYVVATVVDEGPQFWFGRDEE